MDIFVGSLFMITCVLLVVVVLLQKGRGGGLGAAFSGVGSTAFGTRVGDVFTWVTIVLTALFLLLAIFTSLVHRPGPSTVAMPEFRPPPGAITETTVMVSIHCRTSGAEIHYTLEGSDPTLESPKYEPSLGFVKVKRGDTLKARAFRSGWDPSPLAEGYYGPPTTAPAEAPTSRSTPATKNSQPMPAPTQ